VLQAGRRGSGVWHITTIDGDCFVALGLAVAFLSTEPLALARWPLDAACAAVIFAAERLYSKKSPHYSSAVAQGIRTIQG
jgi:hypothetical protein